MAFESFPSLLYCKVLETSEVARAGGFTLPDDQELAHIVMQVYKHGTAVGAERVRLKLYHDEDLTNLYATGSWATLSEAYAAHQYWIGRVRFDFSPAVNIDAGQQYFVAVEAENYTRNGDTFYISFPLDWPLPINTNADAPRYSHAMAFYGRRGVRYL